MDLFRPALKALFEPHVHGLVAKKDLEPPRSLYESFIDTFHFEIFECIDLTQCFRKSFRAASAEP